MLFHRSCPGSTGFSYFSKISRNLYPPDTLEKREEELVPLAGVITVNQRRINFPAGSVKSGEGITSPLCVSAVTLVQKSFDVRDKGYFYPADDLFRQAEFKAGCSLLILWATR